MNCTKCQSVLSPEAKFCPNCGTKVFTPPQTSVTQNVGSIASGGNVIGSMSSEGGNIHIGGQPHYGDVIGGDKIGGDKVGGDKITVGNISGSTGVAIGAGAQASVVQGISGAELEKLFTPLIAAVRQAPPEKQAEAEQKAEALKTELAKGKDANDSVVGKLVDGLVDLVPGAVSAVVSMFATPILGGVAGPVTKFVLDKIQGK